MVVAESHEVHTNITRLALIHKDQAAVTSISYFIFNHLLINVLSAVILSSFLWDLSGKQLRN
jgi:hypothetical protein